MPFAPFAHAGSKKWLQIAVVREPGVLIAALKESGALKANETPTWVSPLQEGQFKEYCDNEAMRRIGAHPLPNRVLADFWPHHGPVWDGLATVASPDTVGSPAFLLLEAKANIPEMVSRGSTATPNSLIQIINALAEARQFYAPTATSDWHLTFFQYANRLAHHYLLKECNSLDSRLVFLNFLNATDVGGPSTVEHWEAATRRVHAALGLPEDLTDRGVYHAYVDVKELH